MMREGITVLIEGDDRRTLSVWNDPDQDEFVVLQIGSGDTVTVRPGDLHEAVGFVQGRGVPGR